MTSSHNDNPQAHDQGTQGRVRWRRFVFALVPSLAIFGGVLALTAQGALASAFSISGQPFEVSANSLSGQGFQQFGTVDSTASKTPVVVAESQIGTATLTNLCQSVVTNIPLLGTYTLRITAGQGTTPVTATDLIVDANQLSGSTAIFQNIQIGRDASTLNQVGGVPLGTPGTFGQQATSVTIDNLRQVAYATSAGTFTLPGFSLNLSAGTHACF